MTPETEKAGRELDALIAEKVMGLPFFHAAEDTEHSRVLRIYHRDNPTRYAAQELAASGVVTYCEPVDFPRLPYYSTDIAAAWEVVEKLGNWHGFDFLVRRRNWGTDAIRWEAGWYEETLDGPEGRAHAEAPTPALAICLAALKAVNGT